MEKRGYYIAFEGCEGCGKTTQIALLKDYLSSLGISCKKVEEPGGTPLARGIRENLLHYKGISPLTEIFLFEAGRSDLIEKEVIPALEKGEVVLSDRSFYTTIAYQGYGKGMDMDLINKLNMIATRKTKPELVFVLDIDPAIGLKKETVFTNFSALYMDFHKRAREAYLKLARENPEFVVIPYEEGVEKMQEKIREVINKRLNLKNDHARE